MSTTVREYKLWLCDPCVDGKGSECHTPGCALFLHAVDIPIILAQVQRDGYGDGPPDEPPPSFLEEL